MTYYGNMSSPPRWCELSHDEKEEKVNEYVQLLAEYYETDIGLEDEAGGIPAHLHRNRWTIVATSYRNMWG